MRGWRSVGAWVVPVLVGLMLGGIACAGAGAPPPVAATAEPAPGAATPSPASRLPADAEVQRILDERLGEFGSQYGIVVGLVDAAGRRVVGRGVFDAKDPRRVDGDTVFEMGSVTKLFTALLLAISVERGEVALDDSLVKHLPVGTTAPVRDGRQITLRDLATHTSGLPRVPQNLAPTDPEDPYANYSVEMLYAYLASAELESKPGSAYAYSNLGMALLARALMVRTNQTYAELVRTRITLPLGMSNTWVDIPAEHAAQFAPGHTQGLQPAPYRTRLAMIGNGGVFSSANDMLTFLSASMGLASNPLASAFASIAAPQFATDDAGGSIGLGWHMRRRGAEDLLWHNGGTTGSRTLVAYDRLAQQAVVVLANLSTPGGVDDIGKHLVASDPLELPGSPRVLPFRPRQEVAIDPRRLDAYVGEYALGSRAVLSVSRNGDQLQAQLTGQSAYPVYPESEQRFFYKVVDAVLTFEASGGGKASAVVLHQNGRDTRAPRIAESAPADGKKPSQPL